MAKELSLREYSQRIEDLLRNARIDEAIAHASQILSAYPKNANAYRNLGRALMRQQRYEEAGEIFRRLLGAIPDDFSAHYQLSIVYEQGKQVDAALFHIERAFDQQPNNKQVNDRLRALYKTFKNTEVAKIQLTAGAVANQYLKASSFGQAIDLLKRTLEKMPDRTDLRLLLARVYWESGQAVDAAQTCIDLLKTSPYVLEANRIMTEFWLEQERPSDAQRFLSRIEELDPYMAFEIATGKAVPDEQFMLTELDFAKYAASINSQQTPDWLDNIAQGEQEDEAPAEADWLATVDAASKPPAPTRKKVTDSLEGLLPDDFDFPISAGADDSVSNAEEDDLAALLGGTGLTDLFAADAANLVSSEAKVARDHTGLTGMLRNLGGADDDDDDSWLQELSSGRYDTGELGAKQEENLDDLFSELAGDTKDTNEFNPAADIAHEEDPLGWLGLDDDEEAAETVVDTGALASPAAAKAYDPNDPMAWLQSSGIDFDDSVEAVNPNFFEDNEPTAMPSKANDPMAWLGGTTDERHLETNEFSAAHEESSVEDPLAWLSGDSVVDEPLYDTGDLSTGTLVSEESDPLSWMAESSESESGDWESDEDVLAELLDLASLTDEDVAASEDYSSKTEAVMSEESDWTANDLPEDDDLGLEWLDESSAEDPVAWMNEAAPVSPAASTEEDPLAWLGNSEEDPMAWLGASVDEEALPVAKPADDFGDLFGEESADDSGFDFFSEEEAAPADEFDFLAEAEASEEAPATTGMTGMLDRLKANQGNAEAADWLGELDTSDAFGVEEDLSWLNTLDGKDNPVTSAADVEAVNEFASDFGDFGSTDDALEWGSETAAESFDWGTSDSSADFADFGTEDAEPAEEMDWMASLSTDDDQPITDDFGDFGSEDAEPAEEMDWMASLSTDDAQPITDDFGDFGTEEAEPAEEMDWMASLGSETEAATDDFGDFGTEDAEPAEEMDWMAELGDEEVEFDDFAAELEPAVTDEFDNFADFGEDEAAEELDWMASVGDGDESDDFAAEAEPAEEGTAWGNIGASGFTDELHEEAEVASAWGEIGTTGFTDELEEEAEVAWGEVGTTGFTDELHEEAEPELDWMSSVSDESDDFGYEEEEEAPLPQKSTFGMTGMLNSIRATRGEELEETLGAVEEPSWLDHVEEEAAEPEPLAPTYQPLPTTSIDKIDWGDMVASQEMDALPFEESEPIQSSVTYEAKPLAEVLQEEPLFVAEPIPSYDDTEDDESHNAPDWLNAMVPGLDLDFEAEEDAAVEGDYAEREANLRERRLSEEAVTSEFGWLQAIVEEESGMMDAYVPEDDYVAPAPPPLPQRQQFRFSQLPLWLRQTPASAIAMSAASDAPDYLSDFEDFDDSGDFDEFDDDFEFEDDDEFDK